MTRSSWESARFKVLPDGIFPFRASGMGLNAVDRVLSIESYPGVGGKAPFTRSRLFPGGQVATGMVACRSFGLERVRYVGKVGDDEYGAFQRASLTEAGVDAILLTGKGRSTQNSVILLDEVSGERTIFWQRPDPMILEPTERRTEDVCCAPVLLLDGEDEDAALFFAKAARGMGIRTVLDTDRPLPGTRALLSFIDFCIGSESFARELTGETDPARALEGVMRMGPRFAASTLGAWGVAFLWEGKLNHVAGYPVRAEDTTGAGDVFHGAFVTGLVEEWPLGRILRFANAAAALNCTEPGARGGIRSRSEVLAFMERTEATRRAAGDHSS